MVKLNLTYVKRTERTSARTNKPFTSLSIKATQYGDKFLSGFGNKENVNWKEGDEVEVMEVKEVSKDGKIYHNFEMPKFGGNQDVMKALEEIRNNQSKDRFLLNQLLDGITEIHKAVVAKPKPEIEYPGPALEPNFEPEDNGLDNLSEGEINGMQ